MTKGLLANTIRDYLSSGYPDISDKVQDEAIYRGINATLNQLLKTQVLTEQFNLEGESMPQGSVLVTYENLPLTRGYGGHCIAKLPVQPLTLPDSMGVFEVCPHGQPEKAGAFLFIPKGNYNSVVFTGRISPVTNICYTWVETNLTIYKDLIGAGIFGVDVVLATHDIAKYGDYDILPIPADLEQAVITGVIGLYIQEKGAQRVESTLAAK